MVAQEQARTPLPSQGKERALILELQRHGQKSLGLMTSGSQQVAGSRVCKREPPLGKPQCRSIIALDTLNAESHSILRSCRSSGFVDKLRSLSSLQDAVASYWPSLTLGANLQLADRAFEPEELSCLGCLGLGPLQHRSTHWLF